MSSIAYSIYDNEGHRDQCYTCPDSGSGTIKARGQNMQLECRQFTELGNEVETIMTAKQTDIFKLNLIDIVPIGVDTARMVWGKKFKFKTQSRGSGGLSKYDCKVDYQIPELIRHDKLGYTELLYVHHKGCPKQYISTELQDMVFESGDYQEAYDPNNQLSDMLIMAARSTVAESVQYTDITGIYAGANEKANSYDGILAQAYWAYTGMAYFHSVQFTIDETVLIDGTYVHAKYSGQTIDIYYDSTLGASDPDLEKYKTRAEVYERLVDWLNNEVLTASSRKYVDATFYGNAIIVTSKWTETTVNLQMYVDATATVESWASCEKFTGVSYSTLQGAMPVDERPVLVDWKKYTHETILTQLPMDIHNAKMEMDLTLVQDGQALTIYIDSYLWETYTNALKTRPRDATAYDLRDDYTVHTLDALSEHGGTGIWILTVSAETRQLRNVAHLIDVERPETDSIYVGLTDNTCREMQLLYDVLHGVMVKDFRLMASNLLCSPFARLLKEPYEKTLKMIPCYNPRVRSAYIDRDKENSTCQISARFKIASEYRNAALYDLDGVITVLEDGEALPNGALPVYEIKIEDTSIGIPVDLAATAVYEYIFETDDGVRVTKTAKDPIFQYAESAAGTTINIRQTVTLTNGCESGYNASDHYDADYPFELRGGCADNVILLEARIDNDSDTDFDLTIVDSSEWDQGDGIESIEIFVYETGQSRPGTPTMTALPENVAVTDFNTAGWTIDINLVTKLGCTYGYATLTGNIAGSIPTDSNGNVDIEN